MSTNDIQSTETVDTGYAEPAYEAVLIFDGECLFCSAAATALRHLPRVSVIAWNNGAAQQFLATKFDEPALALVLIDGPSNRLWIGTAAAGELCDRAILPTLVQEIIADSFERVGDTMREAMGAKWEPPDLDGTYALSAAATAEYRTAVVNARSTHGPQNFANRLSGHWRNSYASL
jgi:predicted DCC family thiol-disulfide oxidoreductase YuxK